MCFKSSSEYAGGGDFFQRKYEVGIDGWLDLLQYLVSVSSSLAEVWDLFYGKYLSCEPWLQETRSSPSRNRL